MGKITLKTTKEEDERFKNLTEETIIQIVNDRLNIKYVPIEDLFDAMEESFNSYKQIQEYESRIYGLKMLATLGGLIGLVGFGISIYFIFN